MKTAPTPSAYKTADQPGEPERGNEVFKRAKVERDLAEARDRKAMIPAERVWDIVEHLGSEPEVAAYLEAVFEGGDPMKSAARSAMFRGREA